MKHLPASPRFTWGLKGRKDDRVIMFNMTRREAERIAKLYPSYFKLAHISTHRPSCQPRILRQDLESHAVDLLIHRGWAKPSDLTTRRSA